MIYESVILNQIYPLSAGRLRSYPLRWGALPAPNPASYAASVFPQDDKSGAKVSVWVPRANPKKPFISWNHASRSVVHALTVFKDELGKPFVRFLIQNRPGQGGVDTVEAPAGKYGDTDPTESAQVGAQRELEEETGLRPQKVMLLSEDEEDSDKGASIATSPGITNERKAFALILAEKIAGKTTELTENEKKQNVRQLDVPLETFLNPTKFKQWCGSIKKAGQLLGMDIPAMRGLLPTRKIVRQFLELEPLKRKRPPGSMH